MPSLSHKAALRLHYFLEGVGQAARRTTSDLPVIRFELNTMSIMGTSETPTVRGRLLVLS